MRTKKGIRYLGVQLHNCRRFGAHFEKVRGKADLFMEALRMLLANVNGSTVSVRKLYYGIWETVVLYAVDQEKQKHLPGGSIRKIVYGLQHCIACSAVRIDGHNADLLQSGTPGRDV